MVVGINVQGLMAMALLKLKGKNVNGEIKESMTKVGRHMQNEVKLSISGHKAEPTSVDTGKFLGSVDFNAKPNEVTIFSPVSYAKHLEYGTSRMPARRHFNNSLDRNKQKINEMLKGQIKNI